MAEPLDTILGNVVSGIIIGPVSFFVGRNMALRDQRNTFFREAVKKIIDDTRKVSDEAQRYFMNNMEERDRFAATIKIQGLLKRLSNDLVAASKYVGGREPYLTSWSSFYNAITEFPFGNDNFLENDVSDDQLPKIQSAENDFVCCLEEYIRN